LLYKNYPEDVVKSSNKAVKDSYLMLSGTSMAAAVVSGTTALMLEANPSLTPNAVKAILAYTAERMRAPGILEQGNGYLNAEGAVRLAYSFSHAFGAAVPGQQVIAAPAAILWGDSVIWNCTIGASGILTKTHSKWHSSFLDPSSVVDTSEDVLGRAEAGVVRGLRTGSSDSWYFPQSQ